MGGLISPLYISGTLYIYLSPCILPVVIIALCFCRPSPSSGNGCWEWNDGKFRRPTAMKLGKKTWQIWFTPFGSVIESNGCFYLQICVKEAQNLVETWYMWNKYLILYSYQHNIISKMWICFIKELESNRELQIPDETSRACVCVCVCVCGVCVCVCEGRALWKRMQIVENHRRKEGSTVRSWLT